jgi:hypothetical protein
MSLLDSVLNAFRGGTAGFSELEHAVLRAILDKLPDQQRAQLKRRIDSVNLVQRLDGGREVNCYCMRSGRPVLDPATRVESEVGERPFAKFVIEGDEFTKNSGQAWLVDGHFFSLEFDQPTEHATPAGISSVRALLPDLAG